MDQKVLIEKIVINVNGRVIEFTIDEIRELKKALNEFIPNEYLPFTYPYPIYIQQPKPLQTYPEITFRNACNTGTSQIPTI